MNGSRRLLRQGKPLWVLSKWNYEHFLLKTSSDRKSAQVRTPQKRRRLNPESIGEAANSDLKRRSPPINFAVENVNIVRPKFNLTQRIIGQENLAIPGNSWVNNWERKSGHDTCQGPHSTREGNNLTGYTRDTLNVDHGGRLVWRQSLQVARQFSNAFVRWLFCVFTHVASIYANWLEQKKAFT